MAIPTPSAFRRILSNAGNSRSTLQVISVARPRKVWSQFQEAAPLGFGVLLTALSQAVRDLSTVTLQSHPRMADFARLVVAAETPLGFEAGEFMRAYNKT